MRRAGPRSAVAAVVVTTALVATACADDGPGSPADPVTSTDAAPAGVAAPADNARSADDARSAVVAGSGIVVVEVTSQRCERPTVHRGVGVERGDGTVLTAAHVVDGDLRSLAVDGESAEVTRLDEQFDLAVVERVQIGDTADRLVPPIFAQAATPGPATIVTPDGRTTVRIDQEITLRVDHLTDQVVHVRPAIQLDTGVERGHSGAPVVDHEGAIVGIVVLSDPIGETSYAVRPPPAHRIAAKAPRQPCPSR